MILYYLFIFLAALFILKFIYNWIRALLLRAAFYIRLGAVCKKRGYALEKTRLFISSFFFFSKKPDLMITAGDTVYCVRIIACRARKRHYHFVNHEWFVRVFRYYILSLAFHSGTPLTVSKRAMRLPPLDEKYLSNGELKSRVALIFNPSPLEITFTSRDNRREIATNGTDFDGWLIYNGKGFIQTLDA